MRKPWANLIDVMAFGALWYVATTAMCQTGCGDTPEACKQCPTGTECRLTTYMPSVGGSRYECVTVVKVVDVPGPFVPRSSGSGGGGSAPASDE